MNPRPSRRASGRYSISSPTSSASNRRAHARRRGAGRHKRRARAAPDAMEDEKRRDAASQRSRSPRPIAKGQRRPRLHDHAYTAWLAARALPRRPDRRRLRRPHPGLPSAHVIPGRPNPGLANKADDAFAWPGCVHHHIEDQHRRSRPPFGRLGVDPFDLLQSALCRVQSGRGSRGCAHRISSGDGGLVSSAERLFDCDRGRQPGP